MSNDYFKYFDEGMSQKDSRDDSKGPASTQKLNYLHSHFERGDSQHKNISDLSSQAIYLRVIFSENRESEDTHEKSIFLLFRQNVPFSELIQGKIV